MADPEKKTSIDAQPVNTTVGHPLDAHTSDEVVALGPDGFRLYPRPVINDALDPLNWTWFQKHTILAIVMFLYFMFTYFSTTTVPSFPDLQAAYDISAEQVNWTVAIPGLGLALGPLFWASPADIIGRRPIFIMGTIVALAATIGAALAPNYGGYMAARFFQGFGVGPAANVGLAIINDCFFEHERGQKVGLWVMAIDLGTLVGPLVGGGLNLAGYQWIQWFCAILFGVVLIAEIFFLPETLYPRARLLREQDASLPGRKFSDEKSHAEVSSDLARTKKLPFINVKPVPGVQHPKLYGTFLQFFRMFKYVVVPISVMTYCFSWYWWLLSVITLVPAAYADYSPDKQGLLFIGLIVGTIIAEVFFAGTLSDRIMVWRAKKNGRGKSPEDRLWLAYPGAILTAIGLIVWGISVDNAYHFMVGQVAFALFAAGIQMGNTVVCAYIVDAYPEQTMAVMTFYSVMLNLSAFVDPFFIIPWLNTAGFTWTFAGHAIIVVFFAIPVYAFLQRFGGALRAKSGQPNWVNP